MMRGLTYRQVGLSSGLIGIVVVLGATQLEQPVNRNILSSILTGKNAAPVDERRRGELHNSSLA